MLMERHKCLSTWHNTETRWKKRFRAPHFCLLSYTPTIRRTHCSNTTKKTGGLSVEKQETPTSSGAKDGKTESETRISNNTRGASNRSRTCFGVLTPQTESLMTRIELRPTWVTSLMVASVGSSLTTLAKITWLTSSNTTITIPWTKRTKECKTRWHTVKNLHQQLIFPSSASQRSQFSCLRPRKTPGQICRTKKSCSKSYPRQRTKIQACS